MPVDSARTYNDGNPPQNKCAGVLVLSGVNGPALRADPFTPPWCLLIFQTICTGFSQCQEGISRPWPRAETNSSWHNSIQPFYSIRLGKLHVFSLSTDFSRSGSPVFKNPGRFIYLFISLLLFIYLFIYLFIILYSNLFTVDLIIVG